jgi:predicted membrane protein
MICKWWIIETTNAYRKLGISIKRNRNCFHERAQVFFFLHLYFHSFLTLRVFSSISLSLYKSILWNILFCILFISLLFIHFSSFLSGIVFPTSHRTKQQLTRFTFHGASEREVVVNNFETKNKLFSALFAIPLWPTVVKLFELCSCVLTEFWKNLNKPS